MAPEDVKKLLIIIGSFLVVFLGFFFLFWQPKFGDLKDSQNELRDKEAKLARLERDAADWPDTVTKEKLGRYEEELKELFALIPSEEELSALLQAIQDYARASELEIISLVRDPDARDRRTEPAPGARYARIPYRISVGGSYFGLIRFLRKLEEAQRLVTVTSTRIYNELEGFPAGAEVEFNIFYSRVGVRAG
jgi:Tfp pilus assembly protein PilO